MYNMLIIGVRYLQRQSARPLSHRIISCALSCHSRESCYRNILHGACEEIRYSKCCWKLRPDVSAQKTEEFEHGVEANTGVSWPKAEGGEDSGIVKGEGERAKEGTCRAARCSYIGQSFAGEMSKSGKVQ